VKISSRIISYSASKFEISDSQAFRLTQRSNIVHSDDFCCIMPNRGCKAKIGGCNCTPCSNVEPPLKTTDIYHTLVAKTSQETAVALQKRKCFKEIVLHARCMQSVIKSACNNHHCTL